MNGVLPFCPACLAQGSSEGLLACTPSMWQAHPRQPAFLSRLHTAGIMDRSLCNGCATMHSRRNHADRAPFAPCGMRTTCVRPCVHSCQLLTNAFQLPNLACMLAHTCLCASCRILHRVVCICCRGQAFTVVWVRHVDLGCGDSR